MVNTMCICPFPCTHVITCSRFCLKQMWRTKEGNGQNDVNTEERDEIGVAVESWL